MNWKPDICIYHFPCDDGFASAWIVNKRWPECEMAGRNYGQEMPDVAGKNVLFADFSVKCDQMYILARQAKSIVVLDHHKTAEQELQVFSPFGVHDTLEQCLALNDMENAAQVAVRFDMDRSGAALTWEFCFPNEEPPDLIRYIEDRDLWRFALAGTRPFSLNLRSFPFEFEVWNRLAETSISEFIDDGKVIERFYDLKIGEVCDAATTKKIDGHDVPVANAPWFMASDVCHELLKRNPEAPFTACWYESYGGRTYSLRSEDSRADASEVAKRYGGGGHRNAAGFRMPS